LLICEKIKSWFQGFRVQEEREKRERTGNQSGLKGGRRREERVREEETGE
jgi:hypothetical protein